jgi:hypothetical protein
MPRRNRRTPAVEAEVIIQRVDPVSRELGAVVAGVLVSIYVPSNCDIVLRGERIKFRMVQSGDRARVNYTRRGDFPIARLVEVQPRCQLTLSP